MLLPDQVTRDFLQFSHQNTSEYAALMPRLQNHCSPPYITHLLAITAVRKQTNQDSEVDHIMFRAESI